MRGLKLKNLLFIFSLLASVLCLLFTDGSSKVALATEKQLIKPEDIVIEKVEVTPQVPPYTLPLEVNNISNFEKFIKAIPLDQPALNLLRKNGFVVISDNTKSEDFAQSYTQLKDKDVPIFITIDSLLHYYHIFFDSTLMKLERELFYDDIWGMDKEFFSSAMKDYKNSSGIVREAARKNVAYFSVALELLKPKKEQMLTKENLKKEYCYEEMEEEQCEWMVAGVLEQYGEKASFKYFSKSDLGKYTFKIPEFVKKEVEEEIKLIKEHKGWEGSPIFIYKEDYSQYVPRGHYTRFEKLKNYFKAVMWHGRMTMLIYGSQKLDKGESSCLDDGIISKYDAKIQNLQANLITKKFLQSKEIQSKWKRLYAITSFFVGFSDDLGPDEYSKIINSLLGDKVTLNILEENINKITKRLLDYPCFPKIYSGLGGCELLPPITFAQAEQFLRNTKGFRLMGQRFTPDSYLFSKIVSPYSGVYTGNRTPQPFTWVRTPIGREVRGFPRGLDIMALFGSERAEELLKELGDTEYSDYKTQFAKLKAEIDSFKRDDWFKNLYWNWLYVLKSLLVEFKEGYPTFMQTKAWQDKELTTALSSWAELRHDTILYVKQSYTMAEMGGWEEEKVVGYVEPLPEFYSRLLTLTKMTKYGLNNLVPAKQLQKLKIEGAEDEFADILKKLLDISKKELLNIELDSEEYDFIKDFGEISEGLISQVAGGETDPDIYKTTLIADVHTDGNTSQVLEEGTGYIKTLIVAYKLPNGRILIGAGPLFSYYEFKQSMKDRLTDSAWREMLKVNPPQEPEWVKSFSRNKL